jgi:hypothetical protein
MGNSNNVPVIFADRIFKPIRDNSWTINYGRVIVTIGIYYCLKQLNEMREKSLIKTTFRRVIVTMILMGVFPAMWVYCIQFYKGFSKDLNSIYLNRENTFVHFYGSEDKITVNGTIDIINCSNDTQKFHIKIKTPYLVKEDIKEEYITLENEFKVYPREEKTLFISEELKFDSETKYSGYNSKAFEYILLNDNDEVVFKGTLVEYQQDDWYFKNSFFYRE